MLNLRTLALALVVLAACGNSYGQDSSCTLKLADLPQAPELLNFRLGMTMDQVKTRVPQIVFGPTDSLGSSKTSINPDFDPKIDKATFPGVRTVSLDFLDARLTSLWMGHDGSFKWKTVDDYVNGISQSLRLPNAWQPWRLRGKQLKCIDFQMTVIIIAEGPSFRILDKSAEVTLAERRAAEEEAKAAAEERDKAEEILGDLRLKIFYPPGCEPAQPISGSDRIVFKTSEEAEKAGFKVAKNCP